MPEYLSLLQRITDERERYGLQMQPPCTAVQLDELKRRSIEELDATIPPEYASFLQLHNGLSFNGLQVFASEQGLIAGYSDRIMEGFVEENLIWRDAPYPADIVLLASEGDVCYGFDSARNVFCAIDSVSGDVFDEYESFDHMISSVLRELLE